MKGEAIPDSLRYVVHILGLGDGLDVVLQDAREVVLQLRAPEVGQDLLPVWRRLRPCRPPSVEIVFLFSVLSYI